MKIRKFKDFKTLYVFDFDDTLVETPRFEDLVLDYLKENLSIKELLEISIKRSGCKISDLKWEDGRIYLEDPMNKFKEVGNWVRKKNRLYLVSPNIYTKLDISLPKKTKTIIELYNSVDNKCIITARSESIRTKIEKTLSNLNIDSPSYGLHMLPDGMKDAGTWKGNKISEIVLNNDFDSIIFYDDNSKYLRKATKVINNILPNIKLETIKVI